MKFIANKDESDVVPINVERGGSFNTSFTDAMIEYTFGSIDVEITIPSQDFSSEDLDQLIDFLKFAKEQLK